MSKIIYTDDNPAGKLSLQGKIVAGGTLTWVTWLNYDVSYTLSGKESTTNETTEWVYVASPYNYCYLTDWNDDQLQDSGWNRLYWRITLSWSVWTLSFYSSIAWVETPYNFIVAQNIKWYYHQLYSRDNVPAISDNEIYIPDEVIAVGGHVQNTDTGTDKTSWVTNSWSATQKATLDTSDMTANKTIWVESLNQTVLHTSNYNNPHQVSANQIGADKIVDEINQSATHDINSNNLWSDVVTSSDNVNKLADISSTGAEIEDAVSKRHNQNTDTWTSETDFNINSSSITQKATLDTSDMTANKSLWIEALNQTILHTTNFNNPHQVSANQVWADEIIDEINLNWTHDIDSNNLSSDVVTSADNISKLADITSPWADIEDAVTKRHSQNTDTGTTETDFDINSGSVTQKATLDSSDMTANKSLRLNDLYEAGEHWDKSNHPWIDKSQSWTENQNFEKWIKAQHNTIDWEWSELKIESIQFDLNPSVARAEGKAFWNADDWTLNLWMPWSNVNLQVGQETLVRCKEASWQTILNGNVVYISGASGDRPEVTLADADTYNTSFVLGIATEDFVGATGYVTITGMVRDVDTSGMTEGAVIWLSQTAGAFTTTRPTAPAISIFLGYIVKVHAVEGIIIIRPTLVPRLQALSDVYQETPSDNEIPQWNQANARFELNDTPEFADVTITGLSGSGVITSTSVETSLENIDEALFIARKPTGITPEEAAKFTLDYDYATQVLTLTKISNWYYYFKGRKVLVTGNIVCTAHTNSYGTYFYSFNDATGAVTVSNTVFDISNTVQIAYVLYNPTATDTIKGICFEERHGLQMDGKTHEYLHETRGTIYEEGGALADYTPLTDTTAATTYSLASTVFDDEDKEITTAAQADGSNYVHMWYTAAGQLDWLTAQPLPYQIASNNIVYNPVGSALVQVTTNNRYFNLYPIVTNSVSATFDNIVLIGRGLYTSLALAQAESFNTYFTRVGLLAEFVPMYKITMRYTTSYSTTTGKSRIEGVQTLRGLVTITGGVPPTDHLSLANLTGGTYTDGGHTNLTQQTVVASTAPTVDSDIDSFKEGSHWIKQDTNTLYHCVDNADGAAVWYGQNQGLLTTDNVTFGNIIASGDLTVNGTTTTINSTTLSVEDKNITMGDVDTPTDVTADGGGITLKGATDKTITWDNANDNWTSSEHWNLVTGKDFKINNVSVLNATTLGSSVVASSLTSVGTLANLTVTNAPTFSAMTLGSVLFAGTAGLLSQDNANFFWDNTNKRLGIATATPSTKLDVVFDVNTGVLFQDNKTDATEKVFRLGTTHYTNAEEPFYAYKAVSSSTVNSVDIGGGTSFGNAATDIYFFTAANNTTVTGTERMRITSTGTIGIGTTVPRSTLDVLGTGIVNTRIASNSNIVSLRINGTEASPTVVVNTNIIGVLSFQGQYSSTVGEFITGAQIRATAVGDFSSTTNAPTDLIFYTASTTAGITERMRIASSGNVGIGTSAPDTLLVVGTPLNSTGNIPGITLGASADRFISIGQDSTHLINMNWRYNATAGSAYAQINTYGYSNPIQIDASNLILQANSAGKVGIGTTAPKDTLHLSKSGYGRICSTRSMYLQGNAYDDAGTWKRIATDYEPTLFIMIEDGSFAFFNSTAGAADSEITWTENFKITTTGSITTLPTYSVTVGATNRDLYIDNTGLIGYVSSIRESKTNIEYNPDTSWIYDLKPAEFNYRKKDSEGKYTDEIDGDKQYGLIAEDVNEVKPELCYKDGKELKGVNYSKLIPVLLKEIQNLKKEIDNLKQLW